MGKKEASKGREWEKGRRDVLNQTFSELHKALPSYIEGQNVSKKTILVKALACIRQLKEEKNKYIVHDDQQPDFSALQKWVQHILCKFGQLLSFLQTSNMEVPPNYISLEAPPVSVSSDIIDLLSKIGKLNAVTSSQPQKTAVKKQKSGAKLKVIPGSDAISSSSECTSPKRVVPMNGGKLVQCQNVKNDFNTTLVANTPLIPTSPVVVQSSPLQVPSQLVFTSNSSNSSLSAPLPLLVSVTGVKTVNPFILVQNNVMAPNPLPVQKVVSSVRNARPIQPGPPSKPLKKLNKMPIPSVRSKNILQNISKQDSGRKSSKRDTDKMPENTSTNINYENISKSKKSSKMKKSSESATSVENEFNPSLRVIETISHCPLEKLCSSSNGEDNEEVISDVNKENVAETDRVVMQKEDGGKEDNLCCQSVSKELRLTTESSLILESTTESNMDSQSKHTNDVGLQLEKERESSKVLKGHGNIPTGKKRLCEVDVNVDNVKRLKCDSKVNDTHEAKSNVVPSNNANRSIESPSSAKVSKSNYSISALCARQQLLQSSESAAQAGETSNIQQDIAEEKNLEQHSSKHLSAGVNEHVVVPQETNNEKSNNNNNYYSMEKNKEASATSFSEWSDKSRLKSERACPSYNIFSSLPLHNSKNTFIPISDIDNFKTLPDSFLPESDSSFGLPLHSSDISNDIFASLHVPTGGHHSESVSPTAAFLLAFPLVSTSKATELLTDETVCENNDSQSGMKTILQIGNLDCDTPVTKCVSVYSSIDNSNVVETASGAFSQNALSSTLGRNKTLDPTVDGGNFIKHRVESNHQKCGTSGTLLLSKEDSNCVHKNTGTCGPPKDNQLLPSKENYQPPCSNNNKQACQTRNVPSSASSVFNNTTLDTSQVLHGAESALNVPSKNQLKSNSSQQPSIFLNCEKQSDWMEMPQTSQATYIDFPSLSVSRSDCAVNYVQPPVLVSSSLGNEELLSVSKSQACSSLSSSSSSSGILSWSTIAPENIQPSKCAPKSSPIQEILSSSKSSSKPGDLHELLPAQNGSTSSQSQLGSAPDLTISSKLNCSISNFTQSLNIVNTSDVGLLLSDKQNMSPNNFISSGHISMGKKSFPAKQVECSPPEAIKVSSNSNGNSLFINQQSSLRQVTSQLISSAITNSSPEVKQAKSNHGYYDDRRVSQIMKSGMNSSGHNTKQTINVLSYDHTTTTSIVSEEKQSSVATSYNNVSDINGKSTIGQSLGVMNTYHHQHNNNNSVPKHHAGLNNHISMGVATLPKKNVSHFNTNIEAPTEVSKQMSSVLNFNVENTSNMMQFGNNSLNSSAAHEEQYNKQTSSHEGHQAKSQQGLQRQHFGRLSNKEHAPNLHRPPVNWMTAPDIRSHQHHSGPSFGNSSNLNSTQGLFYLPEHPKDSENATTVFDQSTNLHCLELPHSGQPLYKGNELHLFGNDNIENFHDNSAWSPNKNGGSSMLGNMMIPSTLPTLVGELGLGDNNISRPFLPSFSNDAQACLKKSVKRTLNPSRRSSDKSMEEANIVPTQSQECVGSFLSVSQLVDSSNASKNRMGPSSKDTNVSYTGSFSDHDNAALHSSKQNSSKQVSSNYSTEALLSSSNAPQVNQPSHRKRRSHGTHYSNSYVGSGMSYQNSSVVPLPTQGPQSQFLPELPRTNEYQGTFLHSETVPPFVLGNPSRSHRNHSYPMQTIPDRPPVEDSTNNERTLHSTSVSDTSSARHRTNGNSSINTLPSNTTASATSSTNIMDFGYMNMSSTMVQDDINFTNHPPPPPPHPTFLSHHSYPMPSAQDTLYTTSRLAMHPPQNSNMQSPSATTLTNFHLSTIFPEINEKVIC